MPFMTTNPLNNTGPVSTAMTRVNSTAGPTGNNPMFGRPSWTYVQTLQSPVSGPSPRLAQGTGRTGDPALPGNSVQLPGYLSDNAYFPTMDEYAPEHREDNHITIPKAIPAGSNGRETVGTYEPHDFTPANRFFTQYRSASNWQVMSFPPSPRQLLSYQQVQKYNLASYVQQARPLPANNYFLGYQIDPSIAAQIGQTSNGGL